MVAITSSLLTAIVCVGGRWLADRSPGRATRSNTDARLSAKRPELAAERLAGAEIRRQIAAAVAAASPGIKNRPQLEDYLRSLTERALLQRRVSALEVEPGRQLIDQLRPSLGAETAALLTSNFLERMAALSATFDAIAARPPAPVMGESTVAERASEK